MADPAVVSLDRYRRREQGRVDRVERWRTPGRFGDLTASELTSILDRADRGDTRDWVELVDFFLDTDPHLASVYSARIDRVVQADWVVKPFSDDPDDVLAAELMDESLMRVEEWEQVQRDMLHALAAGFSANEMLFDYDKSVRRWYVCKVVHRHGKRFLYDDQWQPRLYDNARHTSVNQYGEILQPDKWIVHQHKAHAGYPGRYGLVRACAWQLMFKRWVDKFWIMHVEKFASPFVKATVQKNTPVAVRNDIQTALENISADHAFVIEEGGDIEVLAEAATAKGDETHERYMRHANESITKVWLGASDVVDPGANGARAAVGARIETLTDPIMVSDGANLGNTIRRDLFGALLSHNAHLFKKRPKAPFYRLKTADDELTPDAADRETQTEAPEDTDAPGILDIVERATEGRIPRQAAVEMLVLKHGISRNRARAMLPEGIGWDGSNRSQPARTSRTTRAYQRLRSALLDDGSAESAS